MNELGRLKEEAAESCELRGHVMGWDHPYHSNRRITQVGHCCNCGKEVILDTNPPPNGIDIGGEAVALNCNDIAEWTEKVWKEKIDECFVDKSHQQDCIVSIYKLAFPDWDKITKINGYPTVSRPISEYIFRKCIDFDKTHHPNVMAGGLWMNNGWSVDSKKEDWVIDMSTANAEY